MMRDVRGVTPPPVEAENKSTKIIVAVVVAAAFVGIGAYAYESGGKIQPPFAKIYRSIIGKKVGRIRHWPAFYLCAYYFYNSEKRLCRKKR